MFLKGNRGTVVDGTHLQLEQVVFFEECRHADICSTCSPGYGLVISQVMEFLKCVNTAFGHEAGTEMPCVGSSRRTLSVIGVETLDGKHQAFVSLPITLFCDVRFVCVCALFCKRS